MFDIIFIAIAAFALIVTILLVARINSELNTEIQASDVIVTSGKTASAHITTNFPGWWDAAFIVIWVVLSLAAIISAWFIDTHPVFFFISLPALIVIFIVLIPISNTLETIAADSSLASVISSFPMIIFFINNFFKIMIVEGFLIAISLYAKWRTE